MAFELPAISENKGFDEIQEKVNNNFQSVEDKFRQIIAEGVIFGTYKGSYVNGNESTRTQFINLGFTPVAVEVYGTTGKQYYEYDNVNGVWHFCDGGLALKNHPCTLMGIDAIKIVENGFEVSYYASTSSGGWGRITTNSGTHYFKAYKIGSIIDIN
jgi:hypothetical protein